MNIIEKACTFGNHKNLVGIFSGKQSASDANDLPAVLFLNSGLLHRVGPHRLYVDLSRKFALSGFYSFRFDVSGIGDSSMHKDSRAYEERIKCDVQEAMDYLQAKNNIHKFILIGLCSGADNAHNVAVEDDRVSGIVMLDGYTYPTLGFYIYDYLPYMYNPIRFGWLLFKFCKKRIRNIFMSNQGERKEIFERNFPPRIKVESEIKEFVQHGIKMLYIYTGGIVGFYNYKNQFIDMFESVDFQGLLQLEYFKNADHVFTRISEREKLINCICTWLNTNYIDISDDKYNEIE